MKKKPGEWTAFVPEPMKPWSKQKISDLRKKRYKMSQPRFAAMLNVTPSTVRAWEQGQKIPSGAASRLLQVADADPAVFWRLAELGSESSSREEIDAAWARECEARIDEFDRKRMRAIPAEEVFAEIEKKKKR